MKKKIFMSVFTLMLGFVFTLTTNNVQAATTYDNEAISVTIPAKFENGVVSENSNLHPGGLVLESISYKVDDVGSFSVRYKKQHDLIVLRPYTIEDVEESKEGYDAFNFEDEYSSHKTEILKCELITIDNIPAIVYRRKITDIDKIKNIKTVSINELYSINTDKYSYGIEVTLNSEDDSYLDSEELKNVIKNVKIKGSVTKDLPKYETFKHTYMDITIPDKYINRSVSVDESDNENSGYLRMLFVDNRVFFDYTYNYLKPGNFKEYTSEDLEKKVAEIDALDYENDWNIDTYDILDKELITIDGVSAIKIKYQVKYYYKQSKEESIEYKEKYFIKTDNVEYEIYFGVNKKYQSRLDSNEIKQIINSIKIKDTVKNSRGVPFKDVKATAWYYNAVKHCYTNKYINGTNSYTFAPNTKITRGMLVTILYGMEGAPQVTANNKFSDVKSSKYYYNAVLWAASKGIVNGSNGLFKPDDNITRQDLAVILSAYAMYKGKYVKSNYGLSKYPDSSKISSYAKPAMQWAVKNKIINGANGNLNPKGTATRAEAATMLYSYYLNIK